MKSYNNVCECDEPGYPMCEHGECSKCGFEMMDREPDEEPSEEELQAMYREWCKTNMKCIKCHHDITPVELSKQKGYCYYCTPPEHRISLKERLNGIGFGNTSTAP